MANVSAPSGLSPVRNGAGAAWNQQGTLYWIVSTDNNIYSPGDLVKSLAGCDGNGVPACVKYAAGNVPVGVILAVLPQQATSPVNIPATKTRDYYVFVCDDPDAVFEITDDGITAAKLVSTSVGKNSEVTVANPTAPSPVSATVLLSTSIDTTNTLPLKIVGIKNVPNMSTPSTTAGSCAFARWLVRFNVHEFLGNTTGV